MNFKKKKEQGKKREGWHGYHGSFKIFDGRCRNRNPKKWSITSGIPKLNIQRCCVRARKYAAMEYHISK
jgi:hypothetical protein